MLWPALLSVFVLPAVVGARPLQAALPTISSEPVHRHDAAIFNVVCASDAAYADAPFDLTFDVLKPRDDSQCGSSHYVINDHIVEEVWPRTDHGWSTSSEFTTNTFHESAGWRAVTLLVKTTCAPAPSSSDLSRRYLASSSQTPAGADVLQVTSVHLTRVNGEPVKSAAGFTVVYDQSTRQIMARDDVPDSALLWPEDVTRLNQNAPSSQASQERTQQLVNEEIRRLRDLEADLASFNNVVEQQRVLVNGMSSEKLADTKEKLSKCDKSVGCYLHTLTDHLKTCLRNAYLRYGPHKASSPTSSSQDCVLPTTRAQRVDALVNNRPICAGDAASTASAASMADSSRSSWSFSSDYSTTHSFHVFLAALLSLICLTCLTKYLHRHCCSPRARAERAARREERQVRRQYRNLARRKAWKDWWVTRVHWNNQPASTDYEEKRAMILQQESILEAAMQREIQELSNAHGMVRDIVRGDSINAAEEGRSYQGRGTESLPVYRSRAGSGRPPSYAEVDPHTHLVLSQESLPSGANSVTHEDVTPDSSIANLSPRHSFETLRTERSAF